MLDARTSTTKISYEYQPNGDSSFFIKQDLQENNLDQEARQDQILPDLSELAVVRHFTNLSKQNFSIDSNFYPLGSCTMKYNPRLNEKMARLDGFANIHPLQDESTLQGALELMYNFKEWLSFITGLDDATIMPAAGAHGELAGISVIKQALKYRGENRRFIVVPESAHGTNPATAAICGFEILSVPVSEEDGLAYLDAVLEAIDKKAKRLKITTEELKKQIAGLMLTNPSTCGLFEKEVKKIADFIHDLGGYFYCDGANFNAIMGKIRPVDFGADVMHFNVHKTFSTPHGGGGPGCGPIAVTKELAQFLPKPQVIKKKDGTFGLDYDNEKSIGKMKGFLGQFGVYVRGLAYLEAYGAKGLKQAAEDAVLSANYIYHKLMGDFNSPYYNDDNKFCMHECLFNDKTQKENGVGTLDIAKSLLDYGIHPMTVFFPLVTPNAMLIEPTETETKETLDNFIEVMKTIAKDSKQNPEKIHNAPYTTIRARLDEVKAAKQPILTYDELVNQ